MPALSTGASRTPGLICRRTSPIIVAVNVRFRNDRLHGVEIEAEFDAGHGAAVAKAFRKRMQYIRAAADERDFHALKSLHFEKLKGNRSHEYSMRLNDQWRPVLELDGEGADKVVVIVRIEDYH